MATYNLWTAGCQMNKADSERLASGLEQLGFESCEMPEKADVVVLNTCVVRQSAEDTATGLLGRLKPIKSAHPDRVVAVMGCMVGPRQDDLRRRFPQVDVWARPQQFTPILEFAAARIGRRHGRMPGLAGPRKTGSNCVRADRSRLRQVSALFASSHTAEDARPAGRRRTSFEK